jgi:fructosamine-3-kinase
MDWRESLRAALRASPSAVLHRQAQGGWTTTWMLADGPQRWFVKTAEHERAALLDAEADGLAALRASAAVRVPQVHASGACEGTSWLALDWLDLRPAASAIHGAALGAALAALHRAPLPAALDGRHGWSADNFIGGMPQRNRLHASWSEFWRDERLAPQLEWAVECGHGATLQRAGERLLAAVPALLAGHHPSPSLLHGDLWSGNAGALRAATPVVLDPAVYAGDRETDLAMTELFGGFDREMAAAYRDAWPLSPGYPMRRELYNLYHLHNHLNRFGTAYLARCERALGRLLAELR